MVREFVGKKSLELRPELRRAEGIERAQVECQGKQGVIGIFRLVSRIFDRVSDGGCVACFLFRDFPRCRFWYF